MTLAASAGAARAVSRRASLRRQRRWFLIFCLAPSLAVLIVVTLIPMAYLLATSFTPLNLTNPASEWDFRHPLANYALLPRDARFAISLLFGQDPVGGLGQVTGYSDHRLLMILGAFDPVIQPHQVSSS